MPTILLILFVLISSCVAIHTFGMVLGTRWLRHLWPGPESSPPRAGIFWLLVRVVYGLLLLHLVQIIVWAVFYQMAGCFANFSTAFYFSATSYSTVGYGDVLLPEKWRILGAIEAVTGILMFGWSTGILFAVVNSLFSPYLKKPYPERNADP